MTPGEALKILRRWRQRDEEANLAVRAVLTKYGYENLSAVNLDDPELLVFIHDALEPLLGMDDRFALEDALVREGRRGHTGRVVELPPPEGPARNLPAP